MPSQLIKGQRTPLPEQLQKSVLSFDFVLSGEGDMDISAFALDINNKLVNDDYMIFYNQISSPCGNIKLVNYNQAPNLIQANFECNLGSLPANITQIHFVLSGQAPLRTINSLSCLVKQIGVPQIKADFLPSDLGQTKASILIQLYVKDGKWRISNVSQGFNGGLPDLIRHYGGVVEENTPVLPPRKTISLEKVILEKAPKLVNLAKKATISLEKNKLTGVQARVGVVLDVSGSMNGQYSRGVVQDVINRLVPLAVNFDDDMTLDCWAFAENTLYLGDVTLNNYANFIEKTQGGWKRWRLGSRVNNETLAIERVISHYQKLPNDMPVYILFISDGGVHDNAGITRAIKNAAKLPIFWQFVGLGGSGYGILKKLDTLQGRLIDNCNFFELDNLHQVTEEQLYDLMLQEFPKYIQEAKRISLIRN